MLPLTRSRHMRLQEAGAAGGASGAGEEGAAAVGNKRRASGAKGSGSKKAKQDEDAPARSPTTDLLPLMTGGEMRSYQARCLRLAPAAAMCASASARAHARCCRCCC
jgi:hypothetical protein